jgi:hypothetical protein
MEAPEGSIGGSRPGVYGFLSIDRGYWGIEQLTSTVFPAPWTPLRPRKNGGVLFGSFPKRAWWASNRFSRNGMQY